MTDARVLPDTLIAGRYAIEAEVGRGGMATVYRAMDLKHGRPVAMKVLFPELAAALGSERFLREIRISAGLSHAHLVPLLDSGSEDGILFYTMPLIEGETLRARLRRERQLAVPEVLGIAGEIADALEYAHAKGIVHRDVKPENILLAGGHALLADFGVAYAVNAAGTDRLTATGLAIGSPSYMSPEQAAGGPVDARADLYSLGCLFYEMLAGCPPFVGPTPQAILARHACDPPAPLRTVRPALPPGIEDVVTRLLAKVPADRFPSASALKAALAKAGTATVPVPAPRASRRRLVAGVALAVVVAAGAVLARPRGGTAPQPAWLLVGDFVGPADDSTLADAVRELVTVELDQSASVSTLPRQQVSEVLRSAGLPDSALLTPALARELAYRTSVRAVLSGSVMPVGRQGYSITLRVMSTEDGRQIASVGEATGPDDLIRTAEQLARALRSRLGDRREDIAANRPLEQVATPSFAAYRRYVQGLQRIYSGDLAGGNRLLEEAVQLDSAFASAWAALGESHIFGRNLDSAKHAYARALAFPDRLTDPQRLRLEADVAYAVRHDLPAAIGWYDLYLAERPWSVSVRNNRALYLSSLGRHPEALEEFQRAVAINPFRPEGAQIELLNTAAELVVLGRVPEAEAAARDLTGPFADYFALLRPAALSDWAGADSVAARVADAPDTPSFLRIQARTTRAAAKAARGAVAEAERLLDDAAADAAGEERRWYQHARLLLAVCLARPPGTMPRSLAADSTAPGWVVRALWAAVSGDSAGAARALERAAEAPVEPGRVGAGPALVQGWIDAGAGRWTRVTDNLAPVAQQGEHDATMLDRSSSFPVRWLVAEAYGRLGRNDSARAYLGLVLAPRNMPPGHFALRGIAYPHAHRRLALLSAQAGLSDSAAAHWDRFTRSFSRPDSDLQPLLQQAPGVRRTNHPG